MTNESWPTKDADLEKAFEIIRKHMDLNDGQPLGMFEIILADAQAPTIKIPEWLVELMDYYSAEYGEEQGDWIIKRVFTSCITDGTTIH